MMSKRRKGFKTSPFFWGVIIAFVVLGLYDFVFNRGFRLHPVAPEWHVKSWLVAGEAALVFAAVIFWGDRYERESWKWLLLALIWGAVVAPAISSLLRRMAVFQEAPFPEEVGKGLFALLIYLGIPYEFEDLLDGIVYGAMVGVGFAMVEQVSVLQKMIFRHGEKAFWVEAYRRILVTGLWSHPMLTAFTGAGLGWARVTKSRWQRWTAPLLGFGLAVFVHINWNSLHGIIEQASSFEYAALVLISPYAILLIMLVLLAWRRERKALDFLVEVSTEFASGNIMRSSRARWHAQWKAWQRGGFRLWRRVHKLQRTLMEWAFLRWHMHEGHAIDEEEEAAAVLEEYSSTVEHLVEQIKG